MIWFLLGFFFLSYPAIQFQLKCDNFVKCLILWCILYFSLVGATSYFSLHTMHQRNHWDEDRRTSNKSYRYVQTRVSSLKYVDWFFFFLDTIGFWFASVNNIRLVWVLLNSYLDFPFDVEICYFIICCDQLHKKKLSNKWLLFTFFIYFGSLSSCDNKDIFEGNKNS